jgi:hypothetical protein
MSKDAKTFMILALLLLALFLFLRKRVVTQVSVTLLDSMGNPLSNTEGPLRDQMNRQLTRICDYGQQSMVWNTTDPCPPMYNGLTLKNDTVSPTL